MEWDCKEWRRKPKSLKHNLTHHLKDKTYSKTTNGVSAEEAALPNLLAQAIQAQILLMADGITSVIVLCMASKVSSSALLTFSAGQTKATLRVKLY